MKRPCRVKAFVVSASLLWLPAALPAAEDQWYDPTDWFDGNNWDYSEYSDWGYDDWDDGYYDATYWDDYDWYDRYDADYYDDDVTETYVYTIYSNPPDSRDASKPRGDSGKSGSGKAVLRGTVEGVRRMNLQSGQGQAETYTLARVALDNGKSTVVSLGKESKAKQLDLKKGDRIKAVGARGTVGEETVFIAQRLQSGDQSIAVNRVFPVGAKSQSSSQATSEGAQSQQTIEGEVASFERVTPADQQDAHTLVRLTMENGRTATIDLGANASLGQINLNSGDRVTVRGYQGRVADRQVVVAQQLKVNGDRVSIATE